MAAFTLNMTGSVEVDASVKTDYTSEFILAYQQSNVMDQFVEFNADIGAKSISFPRYASLGDATTPLTEKDDITSEAMVDSEVILTPLEYGNAVTKTRLADLQTGGRAGRGAVALVAQNMGKTMNVLGIRSLEATTNVITSNTNEAAITAGDIITPELLNTMYNKMARASVPTHSATGHYVAFMHDDVIHDLRNAVDAGSWVDVSKYAGREEILRNEVGMFKGFRIVRNNDCLLTADGGSTTVDTYHSSFIGFNAFGKADSQSAALTMTGPFDKLGRFINIGWYGVTAYKIIESDAAWKLITSSSVGVNA